MAQAETYGAPPRDKTLIFLQHGRTAGNATISVFEDEFGPSGLFKIGIRGDVTKTYQDFRKAAAADDYRLYMGHFYFGIHRHIAGPSEYFTTLRNPVERVLSNYEAWGSCQGLSLRDWLAIDYESNNGMVKRLCGIGELDGAPYDYIRDATCDNNIDATLADLDQAAANIEAHIPLVLIHGRFEQNMLLLQRRYGTGPLFSLNRQRQNHSVIPISQDAYDPAIIDEIRRRNELDIQLYEKFRHAYDATVSDLDDAFFEELRHMEMIARVVSQRGIQHMRDEDVLQRLTVAANQLLEAGKVQEVIEILRRFSRKGNVSASFCQNVLNFFSLQGSPDDIASEVDNYRRRFGQDDFLAAYTRDTGLALPA